MSDIKRPYDYGDWDTDIRVFIQCANDRDTMDHKLWSFGLNVLVYDVHPTAWVDIPTGTGGEFIVEYCTIDRRLYVIIGQYYVNWSIQVTEISKTSCSILTYISNTPLPDTTRGFVCTGTSIQSTNYTAIVIWCRTINTSPDNFPRIIVRSRVVKSRVHNKLLHHRLLECLCCL